MTYDSEVAADTPWGYWKQQDASGNLADSSGNARTATVTGSPTYAQAGPVGGVNAILWGNVASQHAETVATTTAGAFTQEVWVYFTANPGARTTIVGRAVTYGGSDAADGEVYIEPDGKVGFHVFDTGHRTITSPAALALNTWHHVVASVGAAGMKIRVSKSTLVTNVGIVSGFTGASQKIQIRGAGTGYNGTGVVRLTRSAYYTTQLSDVRTDAHYDAMSAAPGFAEIEAAAFSVTALDVSIPVVTDISNKLEGFQLGGYVMNEAPDPLIAELPPIWTPTRSDDMALYLPPPTIVDGRIQ